MENELQMIKLCFLYVLHIFRNQFGDQIVSSSLSTALFYLLLQHAICKNWIKLRHITNPAARNICVLTPNLTELNNIATANLYRTGHHTSSQHPPHSTVLRAEDNVRIIDKRFRSHHL